MTKIYVTKWSFSSGIAERDAAIIDGRAWVKGKFSLIGFDNFFLSKDQAIARAEEMRIKKLKALDKKIKKVSAMKFE